MKKKFQRYIKVIFVLVLTITSISGYPNSMLAEEAGLGNDDITIALNQMYSEDDNVENIEFTVQPIIKGISIQEVIDSSGTAMQSEGDSYKHIATKNGEQEFTVTYTVEDNSKREYKFKVETTTIQDVVVEDTIQTDEEKSTVSASDIQPKIDVGDGKVRVEIEDYEEATGWTAGDIKVVTVYAEYVPDDTSKTLDITLPIGMRYNKYRVLNPSNGYELEVDGALKDSITKVTSPNKTIGNSRYGTLSYELGPGTENVKIELSVSVDTTTISKDATISEGIIVQAKQNGIDIGNIKKDIIAKRIAVTPYYYSSVNTVIALKDQEEITLPSYVFYPSSSSGFYFKSIELTFYYPSEFKFISITNAGSPKSCDVDKEAGTITLKYENLYMSNPAFTPIIKVSGVGVGEGDYTVPTLHKVVAYDFFGEELTQNVTSYPSAKPTISVKDSVENKLGLSSLTGYYYDAQTDYNSTGPIFQMMNDSVSEKTDQVYEVTASSDYLVTGVTVPYDGIQNPDGINIYYKTNKNNSSWIAVEKSAITNTRIYSTNSYTAKITKKSLKLGEDEYITDVKGYIGTVSKGYQSVGTGGQWTFTAPSVMGRLNTGVNNASVKVTTYSEVAGNIDEKSVTTSTGTISRYNTGSTTVGRTMQSTTLTAGESTTQTMTFGISSYRYGHHSVLNNPIIYLRVPNGITYSNFKIQSLTNGVYKDVDFDLSNSYVSTVSGETFIKINVNENFGYYFGDNLDVKQLIVNYTITANIQTETLNLNWKEYAFMQDSVFSSVTNANNTAGVPAAEKDALDVDNDGDTEELVTPIGSTTFQVNSKTGLLIDTFITPKDGERKAPYNGSEETAIAFKPETEATYSVDMFNNTKENLEEIRVYIPVPKEGNDFGKSFQTNSFLWNMKLSGSPVIKVYDVNGVDVSDTRKSSYKIEYTSNATNSSNYVGSTYGGTYSDATSMIRLTNTAAIPNGERVVVEFPYVVNETDASIEANIEKLGSVNDFSPYYYFKSTNTSAYLSGTKVGAILSIGTIEGIVFVDNNANGLYDAGDTLVSGGTVKLFAKDNITGVADATAITQYNGVYKFTGLDITEYTLDFSDIPGKFQKFTVSKLGENDDSLKDQDSEITYLGENTGKVFNVNTALLSSKSVNAGIINYQVPTINSTENLYFAKGDVKTDAQLVSVAGVTTTGFFLSDTLVNQKAVNYETVGGPYSVTLSLEDAYESKASHSFNVTIVDQITASGFAVSLDDLEDADFVELSKAKGYDVSDPTKLKNSTVTLSTKKPTTTGVHEVTFKADNGEKKTVKVLVYSGEITANQVINANNFTTTLENLKDADMKDLASAKAYDISNLNDIKEIDVTTVTSKPTKAGKYDITFTTAGGATKTVAGLITEKEPTKKNEVVTAEGFQIKLEDVAEADFITLAKAKGYDVSDVANIKDVEVTMTTKKPTTVGVHTIRFETENGAFTEIEVLVTNNNPTGPGEDGRMEVVVAESFKIDLNDVAEADFIKLAKAKGYSYLQNNITDRKEVEVSMVGEKPTTVGIHTIRFETENGTFTEVNIQIYKHSGETEEEGKIYANDFGYSLDSGELTADVAKQLAQVSAENVDLADIEVTKADLDAINEAIDNKEVNVIYSLTFTTPKGNSVAVSVTLYETGGSQEGERIYGNGFNHKISKGNLTKEQVLSLANILVKKESGEVVSNDGVVVNQGQLDAINEAITNNVISDVAYPLTFTSPKGSLITVQVSLVQDQVTIIDDFRDDDGILVIYRTEDTGENLSYDYSLQLQIDGEDISGDKLSKVTWTVESAGNFIEDSENPYVSIKNGTNKVKAHKSGVVKLTANYEGTKSSIYVVVPGDVNRDGSITTRDATNIQKYISTGIESEIGPVDEFTIFLANMNGDVIEGKENLNTRDSTVIQKMIRDEITSN